MAPFNRSHTSFYSRSMVTMALSCIASEIKRHIGRKSRFFFHTPPALDTRIRGLCRNIGGEKLEKCDYPTDGGKRLRIHLIVLTQYTHVADGQTE